MLDIRAIERILPHRYPFLLVDRVDEVGPSGSSRARWSPATSPSSRGTSPGTR